jgi:ribokinase
MRRPAVLVIGSANIDLVTRAERCPRPGESLVGRSFDTIPGGKGANQAVAAARLGAATVFAGCVGDDAFGTMLREGMMAEGIDLAYLHAHSELPTGTALIIVGDDGENSIVVTPGANQAVTPAEIEAFEPLFHEADVVLLQLEIPLESVDAALDMARRHDALTVLDAGPAQSAPAELIEKAGLISPNETEAEALTGVRVASLDDAREAARQLLELGALEVVMKLGARGCLYAGDGWMHVPAFNVTPVDTTAAGDAFTAALAAQWRGTDKRRDALRYANAAGALAATVAGAQPAMPTRSEVERFLASHHDAPVGANDTQENE